MYNMEILFIFNKQQDSELFHAFLLHIYCHQVQLVFRLVSANHLLPIAGFFGKANIDFCNVGKVS